LDIFLLIFWLISFALLATEISFLSTLIFYDTDGDVYGLPAVYQACVAAAAGVGGVEL
jgi:hypothetical protein